MTIKYFQKDCISGVKHNRRHFLKNLIVTSIGVSSLGMRFLDASTAATDYKALVCIYLYGGNDSANMFVPVRGAPRSDYELARGHLAVQDPLEVNLGACPIEGGLGFNPWMRRLKQLFNDDNLAIQANVGTEIGNRFAHNSQQEAWLRGSHLRYSKSQGWAAKMLEYLSPTGVPNYLQNISLYGSNTWSSGNHTQPFSIGSSNLPNIALYHHDTLALDRKPNLENHFSYSRHDENVLIREYANTFLNTENQTQAFNKAIDGVAPVGQFGGSHLSQQLKRVIEIIQLQSKHDLSRQIFFVGLPGFDTHRGQEDQLKVAPSLYRPYHSDRLFDLSESMGAFYDATVALGLQKKVTTFTMSEFGRTLKPNSGGGTDHGWGGHQMIMGGAVNGGVYGKMPRLSGDDNDLLGDISGKCILKPSTKSEAMFSGLSAWFGLNEAQRKNLFPSLTAEELHSRNYLNF